MTTTVLADAGTRQAIREDLDATLVVEAAAGTGKTTELVARVLALLASGRARLTSLVAVTFTDKAAGEMKLRLRTEIEKMRASATGEVADRMEGALAELEAARIMTIHSFCADILREHPVEAGIDPLFEVLEAGESERLFRGSFERWFQTELQDPKEGVRRMLRRRSRERDADGPRALLFAAGRRLSETSDFPTPWRRDPIDRPALVHGMMERLERLAGYAERATVKNYLVQNLEEVRLWVLEQRARESVQGRDTDGLEAELARLAKLRSWTWKGSGKFLADGLVRETVMRERDATKEALDTLLATLEADLAALLFRDLAPLVAEYEAKKALTGVLDFQDLLHHARNLLARDGTVRQKLQREISHLLVDEFQDTDPLQAEILFLLAGDGDDGGESPDPWTLPATPGKLFVVGDPKQAIYRFRRADIRLYEACKQKLARDGAKVLALSTSFRSVPSLQNVVNAAFALRMTGQPAQASYVPLAPFAPEAPKEQPTFVALPVARPYSPKTGKISTYYVDESFPDTAAAFVEWLVKKSGWTVAERGAEVRVPVAPRHVCLLFKRLQSFGKDVTRGYVRALEARRLPHVLVGGKSFFDREEILALRSALFAVEWPDDELEVYATLRGPFFAFSDAELLAYRSARRSVSPLLVPEDTELPEELHPLASALRALRSFHYRRNRRPIAETVRALLDETRAHANIAIWPAGEQALANVFRFLDLARRFEQGSRATSFRAFVEWQADEADRGGTQEATVVEEGAEGVRIMTVHKAKGLEFPVVILVDPTAPSTFRDPSRYVNKDERLWAMPLAGCVPSELHEHREEVLAEDLEESVRVAYVAATRARDLLVVPVCGDEPLEGWLSPLSSVAYPDEASKRKPKIAPLCPPFGDASVLDRPDRAMRSDSYAVRPGLHENRTLGTRVVWWDPAMLEQEKPDDVGLRQQRILAADATNVLANQGEELYRAWRAEKEAARAAGARPTFAVTTVTALSKSSSEDAPSEGARDATRSLLAAQKTVVTIESTSADRSKRPRGARFGSLVHAVISKVSLAPADGEIDRVAAWVGRGIGATDDEIGAAKSAVLEAIAHPEVVRAAKANELLRERSLVLPLDDGTFLEGAVDLAFGEDDGWTVVDFKTDGALDETKLEAYRRQLELYAAALSRLEGRPVRAVLLRV